jgi:hypothetical protein
MSQAFLILRPIGIADESRGIDTPWLHGSAFMISETDWVDFLALIAKEPMYSGLAEDLRALVPFRELTARTGADLEIAIVADLESWLTEIHRLQDIFDVDLPEPEHYITYFALEQMLRSLLHVLREIRLKSWDFESGLSL